MNPFEGKFVPSRFAKSAHTYDHAANIQKKMIEWAFETLANHPIFPTQIVDIGCGTGNALQGLGCRYPQANKIAIDCAHPMLTHASQKDNRWHFVCADMTHLPLKDNTCGLIFSSATLQWSLDITNTLAEWFRVLEPGGYLCLSTFGEKTLWELKEAFHSVDYYHHVHDFIPFQSLLSLMEKTGFLLRHQHALFEVEHYQTFTDILKHLKGIGATNLSTNRRQSLTGKGFFQQVAKHHHQTSQGLPVTWESLVILAQKPRSQSGSTF